MHQDFNSTSSQKYWSIQEAEARLLVHNLMSEVDTMQLEKHLRKYVGFFLYQATTNHYYYLLYI